MYGKYYRKPSAHPLSVCNNRYHITPSLLGVGSFGKIFLAEDAKTRKNVAIKFEDRKTKYPQLLREAKILNLLNYTNLAYGIPKVFYFGTENAYNVMVLELLGPSLEDMFNKCGRIFSLKTTLMIADQILKKVEYVHSKWFLHRDIKPDNFLVGTKKKKHVIHLIDFGLAKKYKDRFNFHVPYKDNKHLTGTARYASVNNHLGIEQSRRDDLESIGYILVYFLKGSLPWQGLRGKNKKEKYNKICEMKTDTPLGELCYNLPNEFLVFLRYCRSLAFEDKPDYQFLRKMFRDLFIKNNFKMDYQYDWVNKKSTTVKNVQQKRGNENVQQQQQQHKHQQYNQQQHQQQRQHHQQKVKVRNERRSSNTENKKISRKNAKKFNFYVKKNNNRGVNSMLIGKGRLLKKKKLIDRSKKYSKNSRVYISNYGVDPRIQKKYFFHERK